ncbi:MAG: preprotein translocase subunit SecE [Clostridia bacterium]|nr:preprotein translocase subunit SecE [Clostridia bacterium]
MADEAKLSKFTEAKKNTVRFFKEIKNELKKVIWPNRTQLINNTITVLLSCFVVGLLIWVVDLGLEKLTLLVFTK